LPEHCCRAESGAISLFIDSTTVLANEFSISAQRIDKARLDNLAIQLQEIPTATVFIFEKFERNTSQTAIEQKISKTLNYLVNNKKIDSEQIVVGIDKADENLTQFYIVPIGLEKPNCNECVILDNQNFKQQLKELFPSNSVKVSSKPTKRQ
jgi:hypothetical protein